MDGIQDNDLTERLKPFDIEESSENKSDTTNDYKSLKEIPVGDWCASCFYIVTTAIPIST